MRRPTLLGLAAAAVVLWASGEAPARADHGVIAESPGCGYPRFYLPEAGRSGSLPDSFPVRGPAGSLFGRTLADVRSQLVWWTVPMSDGARVQVHRRLLPVLGHVAANLEAEAAAGRNYTARDGQTWGFNARTSVAHQAISYHGLGAAVDINASANPYRRDGVLITDMPAWYVAAWESAGMCWGGNWVGVKDPMHFSWMGPVASPSYDRLPAPVAPLTAPAAFRTGAGNHDVVFGRSQNRQFVVDASGDGAPDVAHLRPWGESHVLELAVSQRGYGDCSVWRWWLGDIPGGEPLFADIEGVGRPDLVLIDESGPFLTLARFSSRHGYRPASPTATRVPTGSRYAFGDADRDGADDLWAIRDDPGGVAVTIWTAESSYTSRLDTATVPGLTVPASARIATADRDVDGRADLLVVEASPGGSTVTVILAGSLGTVAEKVTAPALAADDPIGFEDYDGDGRPDLEVVGPGGAMDVWLGNQPLGGVSHTSWFLPAGFRCPDDTVPYFHDGPFADDDDSVFQADIEWLAAMGITRGCNPPFEDRFCPEAAVTRGQMAAFLHRGLGLAPAEDPFQDTVDSEFGADIGALAAAGITRGCDPPRNDRFCPHDAVTRGEMAAFLTRAFGLAPAANRFVDTVDSVFEADIGALAAAGITRGCNPPRNDRFCPQRSITRGEMAAFLHRGEGLLPNP